MSDPASTELQAQIEAAHAALARALATALDERAFGVYRALRAALLVLPSDGCEIADCPRQRALGELLCVYHLAYFCGLQSAGITPAPASTPAMCRPTPTR